MSGVAIGFVSAKNHEKAKLAFEKASQGQEMLASYPLHSLILFTLSSSYLLPLLRVKLILVFYDVIGFTLLKCRLLFVLDKLIRPWNAAEHMESAAALAKELSNWREVGDFCQKASQLYMECGRPQPASDALAKAAR